MLAIGRISYLSMVRIDGIEWWSNCRQHVKFATVEGGNTTSDAMMPAYH